MKLQRQLSNGMWSDVEANRVEEFLNMAIDFEARMAVRLNTPKMSREEYIQKLQSGKMLNWDEEWYAQIRDADSIKPIIQKPVEMIKCSCGHTVPKTNVMSASMGSSCPDCYDRLSM